MVGRLRGDHRLYVLLGGRSPFGGQWMKDDPKSMKHQQPLNETLCRLFSLISHVLRLYLLPHGRTNAP
jgi:hypothetical protein